MADVPDSPRAPWPGPLGPALPFVVIAAAYVIGLAGATFGLNRGVGDPITVFVGLPLAWGSSLYVKGSRGRLVIAAAAVCIAGVYLGLRAG